MPADRPVRLPLWFRAVLVVFFLVVAGTLALVTNRDVRAALASTVMDRMLRQYVPVLEQTVALPRPAAEPANGAYYVNGMLVRYRTLPAPIGPAETLRRFDAGFHQTGYVTRLLTVMGKPTLVGIHPKTKMLLTVRPEVDGSGQAKVRLSEQDLSKLNPRFRAEIPGLPMIPGARGRVLVRSASGREATSLMFTVNDSVDGAVGYYERELAVLGWRRLQAPSATPFGGVRTLFFQKDGKECYLVAGAGARSGDSTVMLMLTEKASS